MGKVIEMKRATLSMQQANLLFNRSCMAMSGKDCISIRNAISILNDESVQYALRGKPGEWWNVYSIRGG